MRGYLKAAGVIQQCTRCFSLRDLVQEEPACKTCWAILGITHTETRPLVLGEVSTDDNPTVPSIGAYTDNQAGVFQS
jgi:hypothetical protein